MKIIDFTIRTIRFVYRLLTRKQWKLKISETNRQISNDIIFSSLISNEPCMISRFGTVEINTVNNFIVINSKKSFLKKCFHFITDNTHTPWWNRNHFIFLQDNAGVFPATQGISEKFAKLYLSDIPEIDILGSFQYYEKFMPLKPDLINLHLETLYPFFVERPWTKALEGRRVLIVHPFEETIKYQYKKRKQLFENQDVLPEFELITFKAIQSAAGVKPPFVDWFEALNHMKDEISKIDFDICLLGCGAYGLPLAAHIKRLGKKAVHIGGGLQLLFGIKGKRWDNVNYGVEEFKMFPNLMAQPYCSLYNVHWIKPFESDTPESAELVEGACYW
jgi:hypothetical protein